MFLEKAWRETQEPTEYRGGELLRSVPHAGLPDVTVQRIGLYPCRGEGKKPRHEGRGDLPSGEVIDESGKQGRADAAEGDAPRT
ncbi:MAG: hypothetical protein QXY39_06690 [Thermofilaceae archaeon]